MKNQLLSILCVTLWLSAFNANAVEPKQSTQTIEASKLQIVLGKDLNGYVTGKICDQCETLRVVITPETLAFAGRTPVPLILAKERAGKDALVTFEEKSLIVKTIHW